MTLQEVITADLSAIFTNGFRIFVFPWEGVVLVGTTDVDHAHEMSDDPRANAEEVAYLMAALDYQYPSLQLEVEDILSTFAGVRPIIGSGEGDPHHESREHVVWQENGLLTVTGGKLTTFRIIARDALDAAGRRLPAHVQEAGDRPLFAAIEPDSGNQGRRLEQDVIRRLQGRYGAGAVEMLATAPPDELELIPGTPYLWAEMRWAARSECVVHLEDLLARRLRMSLLLPDGGQACFPQIERICRQELGWDDAKWADERARYLHYWQLNHRVPEEVPDWRGPLQAAQQANLARYRRRRKQAAGGLAAVALLGLLVSGTLTALRLGRRMQARSRAITQVTG